MDNGKRNRPSERLLTLLAFVSFAGCVVSVPPLPDESPARFAVVITNQSDFLVNVLLAVAAGQELTWAVPVGPHTWDSLILDCDVDQVTPIGALVTDPLGESDGLEIDFSEPPFVGGLDFDCGSIIAVAIENSTRGVTSRPISASARTTNRATRSAETSGFAPSAETGFILLDASAPAGVPVRINFGWEGTDSRVFQSSLTLSGRETQFGALLTCPISRFTLGQLDDSSTAGAVLINSEDRIDAPAALPDEPVPCGGVIEMRLVVSSDEPTGYTLTLSRTEAGDEQTGNMYDDIRTLLEAEGLADQPSSLLSLLPPPVVGNEN